MYSCQILQKYSTIFEESDTYQKYFQFQNNIEQEEKKDQVIKKAWNNAVEENYVGVGTNIWWKCFELKNTIYVYTPI